MKKHKENSAVSDIVSEVVALCKQMEVDGVKRGPKPKYTDSYIISLIILKNLLGMNSESSFLRYLRKNHPRSFPDLPERSWFNRKSRWLTPMIEKIQKQLVTEKNDSRTYIIDSTPTPTVKRYRGHNSVCFPKGKQTNFGYCASKKEYYFGVKLSVIINPDGLITNNGIHPANRHDLLAGKDILSSMDTTDITLIGDKGYYDGDLRFDLKNRGGHLCVPDKKRHHKFNTKKDKKLLKKRQLVETVINQLKSHFRIEETLARSYEGLVARLTAAILTFTFAFCRNLNLGRPLLAIKSVLI